MIEVQFENYVRNVRSNAHSAMLLAQRLEKAAPGDLNAQEKKALREVIAAAVRVREVRSERERLAPVKLRAVLDPFVNDWSALHGSLASLARVSPNVSKDGPAAKKVLDTLFVDGLAFVQLAADRAWVDGDRLLHRIEEEGLAEEIDRLVGAHFLAGVKRSTKALGEALGVGKNAKPIPSSTGLIEALQAFGRAVSAYGRVMSAGVDQTDEASVTRFLKAMAPIDAHRANAGKGGSGDDDGDDFDGEPTNPGVTPQPISPQPEPVG